MNKIARYGVVVGLLLLFPLFAFAEDEKPDYAEAVQLAIAHASNPAGWRPASLFVIPDTTAETTEGLTYDGSNLIVRTATKSAYVKNNFVGQPGTTIYGSPTAAAAWVTTGNDATKFLTANGATGANVTTLLERGLGMNATGTHDAIVEYAVDTQYLLRPTRNPDISQYLPDQYGADLPFPDVPPAGMSLETFNNFKAYYDYWKGDSGPDSPHPFPWTQLGYTFFWGNGYDLANINGMSEFILLGGTPVQIQGIYATQSYIYTRNKGGLFSADADAQYGNGFASFNVDGACDTIWAGHRFQKGVSYDTANPNRIVITPDGAVSGGQGLLVWSLNYEVENRGVISGATGVKFGIPGTEDIAVLFKGDTTMDFGTPVTEGGNFLVNFGTIDSPGTAVKAEAGNTAIVNLAGGTIVGGNTAIDLADGNDEVMVLGGIVSGGLTGISTGAGNDLVGVYGGGFDGPATAALVGGSGPVTEPALVIGMNTAIATGDGRDTVLVIGGIVMGLGTAIDTGAGNDHVFVMGGDFAPGALALVEDPSPVLDSLSNGGLVFGLGRGIATGDGRDDVMVAGGTVLGLTTGIDTGDGRDEVRILNGTVIGGTTAISTGKGRDRIEVRGGRVDGGDVAIATGAGNDMIVVRGVPAGPGPLAQPELVMVGESQGPTVFGGITGIDTGAGKDRVGILGGTVFGGVTGIDTGGKRDEVFIAGGSVTGGTTGIATGDGRDRVKVLGGTVFGGTTGIATGDGRDKVAVKGGVVSGGEYAIKTGKDDDKIVFKGGEIAGRIDMGAGTDSLTVKGSGDPRFHFTLDRGNAAAGQIVNTENVEIVDGSHATLAVTVAGATNIRNNDRFLIVDAQTLSFDPSQLTILNDPRRPMVTFTAERSDNQLSLVATRDMSFYGRRSGNGSLGALLDSLAQNGSGEMPMILEALDDSGDAGNARQLEPTVNGGALQAGFGTASLFNQAVISRIEQLLAGRLASGMTGLSTGDAPAREGIWGQAFGAGFRQDTQGLNIGYQGSVQGGAFGYDRFVFDHLMAGFGGGYAQSRTKSLDDRSRSDIEGYQANLYGSLARDGYHIDALVSFAYNHYDTARDIVFAGINRTARADYSGQQVSVMVEGGYAIEAGGFVVTPVASVQAMRLHISGYSETGAGTLDLTTGAQDYNLFKTGLGAKLAYPIQSDDLRITPEVHAKWLYDFAGDRQQSMAQFAGGGAAFATQGIEPAQSACNVGAKLTLLTKSSVTVSLSYDYEQKADFYGHAGSLTVRYAF